MGRVIAYIQAGGFGSRLYPLLHQPGMRSVEALSPHKRNLMPFNHNSYYAVAKPVMPYFGVSLSEPLVRRAVKAGITDLRITLHNLPETVIEYYVGRPMSESEPVYMGKFLYEHTRLDTSGGIVRDVVADMRDGTIKPEDTILVLGGDVRTDINIPDFLAEHEAKHADISIALAQVPREEMWRFGAALREGDKTPTLGAIKLPTNDGEKEYNIYGELILNPEKVARIIRFFEKAPKLDPEKVIANPAQLIIEEILEKHGVGALAPTDLQNGSIYAIRAELIYQLAPLVFNLDYEASASAWRETSDINLSGPEKYSDFGGDWFMTLTGSKPMPEVVDVNPRTAELKRRIIEDMQSAPPQIFGHKIPGYWSDDGTLESVLNGHFKILDDLVKLGRQADWPINWNRVKMGLPPGVITMSNLRGVLKEITLIPPVFIEDEVIIQPGAKLGPYAVIGRGWEVAGKVARAVLFPKKRIDQIIEGRGWKRYVIPADFSVEGSIVGSGIELVALDHEGKMTDKRVLKNAVVVSNGSQNVISPIEI